MDVADLHRRLPEIAPAALSSSDDAEVAAIEAHASSGCSRCARVLVNARETGVDLAVGEHVAATPRADLRGRVLAAARAAGLGAQAARPARRFFDPAGEIARLHLASPDDAARVAEIDALAAMTPHEDDACERVLAQAARMIDFPLLFVSVVRGARAGYRAQHGLDEGLAGMRDRRRETTFCTHTISCGEPLVVPNAAAEPFFRGHNPVLRLGVQAYVGVPLATSRGVAIGTLCAMAFRARAIDPGVPRLLDLLSRPVLAEIERDRLPIEDRLARAPNGAPLYPEPLMRALLEVEPSLARSAGRPSTLVVARAADAPRLADLAAAAEPVGRVAAHAFAWLLPGVDREAAQRRASGVTAQLEPLAPHASGAAWLSAAVARLAAG